MIAFGSLLGEQLSACDVYFPLFSSNVFWCKVYYVSIYDHLHSALKNAYSEKFPGKASMRGSTFLIVFVHCLFTDGSPSRLDKVSLLVPRAPSTF